MSCNFNTYRRPAGPIKDSPVSRELNARPIPIRFGHQSRCRSGTLARRQRPWNKLDFTCAPRGCLLPMNFPAAAKEPCSMKLNTVGYRLRGITSSYAPFRSVAGGRSPALGMRALRGQLLTVCKRCGPRHGARLYGGPQVGRGLQEAISARTTSSEFRMIIAGPRFSNLYGVVHLVVAKIAEQTNASVSCSFLVLEHTSLGRSIKCIYLH